MLCLPGGAGKCNTSLQIFSLPEVALAYMSPHNFFGPYSSNPFHCPVYAPGNAVSVNNPDAVMDKFKNFVHFPEKNVLPPRTTLPGGICWIRNTRFRASTLHQNKR